MSYRSKACNPKRKKKKVHIIASIIVLKTCVLTQALSSWTHHWETVYICKLNLQYLYGMKQNMFSMLTLLFIPCPFPILLYIWSRLEADPESLISLTSWISHLSAHQLMTGIDESLEGMRQEKASVSLHLPLWLSKFGNNMSFHDSSL